MYPAGRMRKNLTFWVVVAALGLGCIVTSGLAVRSGRRTKELAVRLTAAQAEIAQREMPAPEEEATAEDVSPAEEPADTSDTAAEADALQEQIADLEARLREKDGLIAAFRAAQTNEPWREHRAWPDRRARLDELRQSDPKQYEEIMARREEARQRLQQSFAEKAHHFLDRDTSDMSEEERAEYNTMLKLLDDTWRLAERLRTDLPPEERRPVMRNLRENMEVLVPLLDTERDREFRRLAKDFGFADDEAAQFVDYMNNIVEVTSMRSVFDSMRPGRPGGSRGRTGAPANRSNQ